MRMKNHKYYYILFLPISVDFEMEIMVFFRSLCKINKKY